MVRTFATLVAVAVAVALATADEDTTDLEDCVAPWKPDEVGDPGEPAAVIEPLAENALRGPGSLLNPRAAREPIAPIVPDGQGTAISLLESGRIESIGEDVSREAPTSPPSQPSGEPGDR